MSATVFGLLGAVLAGIGLFGVLLTLLVPMSRSAANR